MADLPLIELNEVNQIYHSESRTFTAVNKINLKITEGEFVALLGPSGCGKSTLLRIITGLQTPTEGKVYYRGQELHGVNENATIVFQTFALYPWLTVLENVELALKARGVVPKLRTSRAIDLLDKVGLDGFEMAYPRELSGGMRQKVGFARAMAVEPELLCLDEPFSALDVLSADSLRGELIELWTGGIIPTKAILMVTHNINEAIFLADRIVVMDKEPGKIVSELRIDLPHPRDRKSQIFNNLIDRVYSILAGQTQSEQIEMGTAPGEPGITRALPYIHISDLAGLLEGLDEMPDNKGDIYLFAEQLKLDSDLLLRLTEGAELLGFVTVQEGDIQLTPLGQTFADARILIRKEIFGTRIRRLPIFRWLLSLLRAADQQKLEWDVIQKALELEFPQQEAERQLETIINWGRYAEILAYDDDEEEIYLEDSTIEAK